MGTFGRIIPDKRLAGFVTGAASAFRWNGPCHKDQPLARAVQNGSVPLTKNGGHQSAGDPMTVQHMNLGQARDRAAAKRLFLGSTDCDTGSTPNGAAALTGKRYAFFDFFLSRGDCRNAGFSSDHQRHSRTSDQQYRQHHPFGDRLSGGSDFGTHAFQAF